MKERPILFSAPMVRAILDGRKTVTRRIVRVDDTPIDAGAADEGRFQRGIPSDAKNVRFLGYLKCDAPSGSVTVSSRVRCPYGVEGDRLWVRERQRVIGVGPVTRRPDTIRVCYEADGAESGLLPYPTRLDGTPKIGACLAYGGYRESSRITLAVEAVCVERLQDISEEDARAEGVDHCDVHGHDDCFHGTVGHRCAFEQLWDSINGDRAPWNVNPWVWVIGLRRVTEEGRRG